jgi:hypothetical protein
MPSKEELAKISLLDSINLSGQNAINSLEPLRNFKRLKTLIAAKKTISDLSPLSECKAMEYLDISGTNVTDLKPLNQLRSLKLLKADDCKIENPEVIRLPKLELFYADNTSTSDESAKIFLEKNPDCLLVYKTSVLKEWWIELTEDWKIIFKSTTKDITTRENLHRLVEKTQLQFSDVLVNDLSGLREFIRLRNYIFLEQILLSSLPYLHSSL